MADEIHPDSPKEAEPLLHACSSGDLTKVRQLIESYFQRVPPEELKLQLVWPVLARAISVNEPAILSYLFSVGCPFHILYVWPAAKTKSTAIFEVFLQEGWDINQPLDNADPPALALVVEDFELTRWFLDHGADPNARCYMDITPLSYAVTKASLETISLLFDRGGTVDKGQLIHHAVERNSGDEIEVVKFLLQKGASLNVTKYYNDYHSFDQEFYMGLGTPLHKAAELGKVELASFLLAKGADRSLKDSNGRIALDRAKESNHPEIVSLLEKPEQ